MRKTVAGAAARRGDDADEAVDVAVVAEDDVAVAGVAGLLEVAVVVADEADAGAAEDRVGTVGPPVGRREAEEVGAAADEVVPAEAAEDHVVAAVALDLVVAVAAEAGEVLDRLRGSARTSTVIAPASSIAEPSPWSQSSPSWPKITSSSAPPAMTSAPYAPGGRRDVVVEQHDVALLDPARVVVRRGRGRAARGGRRRCWRSRCPAAKIASPVSTWKRAARDVAGAEEVGVVAGDHVVLGAAVDEVAGVAAARDVVAADEVVVAGAAGDAVGTLAADDDVVAGVAAEQVGRRRPARRACRSRSSGTGGRRAACSAAAARAKIPNRPA